MCLCLICNTCNKQSLLTVFDDAEHDIIYFHLNSLNDLSQLNDLLANLSKVPSLTNFVSTLYVVLTDLLVLCLLVFLLFFSDLVCICSFSILAQYCLFFLLLLYLFVVGFFDTHKGISSFINNGRKCLHSKFIIYIFNLSSCFII